MPNSSEKYLKSIKDERASQAAETNACVRAHDRSLPHLVIIRFQLAFPLSQARTPWTRQARLRSPNACVRAHDRSLPHLVIIGFRLTAPLSQAPSLGQDELTRRKCDLDTRGLTVRLHTLHNRAQTSNKAHDKFVPLRDCACADHLRPSLSPALLSGWSSHLVNPYTFAQSID